MASFFLRDADRIERGERLVILLSNTPTEDFCPNAVHGAGCGRPCGRFRGMVAEAKAIIENQPAVL